MLCLAITVQKNKHVQVGVLLRETWSEDTESLELQTSAIKTIQDSHYDGKLTSRITILVVEVKTSAPKQYPV